MDKKSLKDHAISFKGKDYVQVKDRITYFNNNYPDGCIKTDLITPPESEMVVFRAIAIPDAGRPTRYFTGYSQAKWADRTSFVNSTSALENAETSAVGRALALMGIGILDAVASIDEVQKAVKSEESAPKTTQRVTYQATDKQITFIEQLLSQKGFSRASLLRKYEITNLDALTADQADDTIKNLVLLPSKKKEAKPELSDEDTEELNAEIDRGMTFKFEK